MRRLQRKEKKMNQFSNYALEQIEMGNSQYRIIAGLKNYIAEIEDKLSRRNLQIKDLKKQLDYIKQYGYKQFKR